MGRILTAIASFLCLLAAPGIAAAQSLSITEKVTPDAFPLFAKTPAAIVYDPADAAVVSVAAHDLGADIGRVTGTPAPVAETAQSPYQVWIGTIGHSALIDNVNIDKSRLANCWECYLITTVANPKPGVKAALVIIGSDRRGTAYGAYELSQAIGVSPWYWWADVTPAAKKALYVAKGAYSFGPPSVKYRGIFINDEDWGLKPWAVKHDPSDNIGPATYQKVFELLLRLKADTLWPAMHPGTAAFNSTPENAALADKYAIVMGASHAEPMLRNNVSEWKDKPEAFNYVTNRDGVDAYWRERLKTNGRYENLYTLGMRGIHDSAMQGVSTLDDKTRVLNQVIADQRQMLKDEVGAPEKIPQIFVPYKEVLDVYHGGLNIPDDVTLVWPDDNFGYIRHFPTEAEKKRPGGSGIYYHLSYLGAPLSYIWLSTTPPALINEEMTRAYDNGADRVWIVNVGDIKPAEVDLSYFMQLAWDVPGTRKLSQSDWLTRFAGKTFGEMPSKIVGSIWDEYYRANFTRRPEHLQWFAGKQAPKASPLTYDEVRARLRDVLSPGHMILLAEQDMAPGLKNAAFQLIDYPVKAAAFANSRYFMLECLQVTAKTCEAPNGGFLGAAHSADDGLKALTAHYNSLNDGKWAGLMNEEPADDDWKSFRIGKPIWPDSGIKLPNDPPVIASHVSLSASSGWTAIEGMGRDCLVWKTQGQGAPLMTTVTGDGQLTLSILPTYTLTDNADWVVEVSLNGGPRIPIHFPRGKQDTAWSEGVLNNRLTATVGPVIRDTKVEIFSTQPDLIVEGLDLVKN